MYNVSSVFGQQAGNDLYAFVAFAEHRDAQVALLAMNKRIVLGRVIIIA